MGSGKVLVAGGITNNPLTPPTPPCYNTTVCFPLVATNTTEVFDPATGAWTMGPSMPYNRASQFQVLLPDGKVFISGGTGEGPRLLCGCSRAPGAAVPLGCALLLSCLWQRATCIDRRSAGAFLTVHVVLCRQPGLPQPGTAPPGPALQLAV